MSLTADQILALAPDAASAKAGSAQASRSKWSGLGVNSQAMWGLCQGSGKDPYKAQIDLSGPSFKCTCPSRKFPCKHGLGLYLLFAREAEAFGETEAPQWVSDWLQSREQRSEKKAARLADDSEQTPDQIAAKEKSQLKRQEKREGNVDAGLAMFDTWLADLAREGLAGLRSKPSKDWDAIAARLVDTQASGLATRLRRTGLQVYAGGGEGWEAAAARELAQLAMLSQAYRRIDSLPAGLQHDVRSAIGWATKEDDVLAQPGVHDRWLAWGFHTEEDQRISRRACYLRGERSGRWAMLLQFSAGAHPLPPPLLPGTWREGTLHFYPGAAPLRVVPGSDLQLISAPGASAAPPANVDALMGDYAQALALNPFIEQYPMLLEQVTVQLDAAEGPRLSLRAPGGALLPVERRFSHGWQLLALSGGSPATVFGTWNGENLMPLTVRAGDRLYRLGGERAA